MTPTAADDQRPVARSGSLKVAGATLRHVVEGNGIPALVVGSAVYYPRTFSQRLRRYFRLAFMDLRHFAENDGSAGPERIGLDSYMEDIEQVRAALGLERLVLIGHSHHGNLALEYAKRHPRQVAHLVLIGTPPCDVEHTIEGGRRYWDEQASAARKAALQRNRQALDAGVVASLPPDKAFVTHYVADGPRYWYDPTYDAWSLWQGVPINMDAIGVFRDFFTDYEFSWRPERMKAPVLVVMGKHDYAVPPILWDEALPNLPNVTYHLLEQSGHTPQLEEPAVFDRILLEWLGADDEIRGSRST